MDKWEGAGDELIGMGGHLAPIWRQNFNDSLRFHIFYWNKLFPNCGILFNLRLFWIRWEPPCLTFLQHPHPPPPHRNAWLQACKIACISLTGVILLNRMSVGWQWRNIARKGLNVLLRHEEIYSSPWCLSAQ